MEASLSQPEDKVKLEPGWKKALLPEFSKSYMASLRQFLSVEIKKGKTIYPRPADYFSAFNFTPLNKVKVVILGQDPYHGPRQAHGLCFSVKPGVPAPPSLVNIYKEMQTDLGLDIPKHGYLVSWAKQGVFLLNSVMTVEASKAGSHRDKGWETFTDKVIEVLNQNPTPLVFILWGSYAQAKGKLIDRKKHCVIEGPHPSPLSSYRGFFGSRPFSKANAFLKSQGIAPVNWQLPDPASILEENSKAEAVELHDSF
jgi:uracil-DNA glycosylase